MTQNSEIRPARPEDIAGIAQIECESFSHPWTREDFLGELSQPHARLYAAVCGETVCGYLDMHIVADSACVNNIAVASGYRRRGLGRALLLRAIEQARAEGCVGISLEVRQSNLAAQGLYSELGFRPVGTRRGFYRDPPEDGVIMLLYLEGTDAYFGN